MRGVVQPGRPDWALEAVASLNHLLDTFTNSLAWVFCLLLPCLSSPHPNTLLSQTDAAGLLGGAPLLFEEHFELALLLRELAGRTADRRRVAVRLDGAALAADLGDHAVEALYESALHLGGVLGTRVRLVELERSAAFLRTQGRSKESVKSC